MARFKRNFLSLIYLLVIFLFVKCSSQEEDKLSIKSGSQSLWKTVFADSDRLVINEFMAKNDGFLASKHEQNSDWIEIYNGTNKEINLGEYYLSDDKNQLDKWKFPSDLRIQPKSHLIIFASGRNEEIGNEIHCNFSIKSSGEAIFLSHNNTIIHELPAIALGKNKSVALLPDGGNQFYVVDQPTPGAKNSSKNSDVVSFSHDGGWYEEDFLLSLKNNFPEHRVFYALYGEEVDTTSIEYRSPVQLSSLLNDHYISDVKMTPPSDDRKTGKPLQKAIVIKAAVFDSSGVQKGPTTTKTFFIGAFGHSHNELPILSIVLPKEDLIDYKHGLFVPGKHWDSLNPQWSGNYYKTGKNWEKKAFIELYNPTKKEVIQQYAGLRVHGGNNRRGGQKALRLYARKKYDSHYFNYSFIAGKTVNRYKRIVLRPFMASWTGAGVESTLANALGKGLNVSLTPSSPTIVYINGEYWGVYFFEEKTDYTYFETNYGLTKKDIDVVGNWEGDARIGSSSDFLSLYEFVEQNDLRID